MNEISNFCSGECSNNILINNDKKKNISFDPNNPPYKICNGGYPQQDDLHTNTLSMDCKHDDGKILEYNCHNLFGLMETWATKESLEKIRGKRAVVISRSTFASSGYHGGHWTGDTISSWSDLYYTIPDLLNFNMFGIPFIGADICGFGGDTTEELCARWIELGAFYPFSRNHNSVNAKAQELYQWPLVAKISRNILRLRYSLLPYFYTLFHHSHIGKEATIWRPLFF